MTTHKKFPPLCMSRLMLKALKATFENNKPDIIDDFDDSTPVQIWNCLID